MSTWERIREGLDELQFALEARAAKTDLRSSKLSGAPAPPQNHPAQPQIWGPPPPPPRKKPRQPGADEVDLHVRLPRRYRGQLEQRRRELGMSLTGAIADLIRRGLDEPPPGVPRGLQRKEVREGLVEEAVLASLVAIEHTRLLLELLLPDGETASEDVLGAAAVAAEHRLLTARRALGAMEP